MMVCVLSASLQCCTASCQQSCAKDCLVLCQKILAACPLTAENLLTVWLVNAFLNVSLSHFVPGRTHQAAPVCSSVESAEFNVLCLHSTYSVMAGEAPAPFCRSVPFAWGIYSCKVYNLTLFIQLHSFQ